MYQIAEVYYLYSDFIQIAMNSGLILDREEQEDAHLAKASGSIQLGILVCCGIKQIGKWVLV